MKEKLKEVGGKTLGCLLTIVIIGLAIYFGMRWQANRDAKYPWVGTLYKVTDEERDIREDDRFRTLDECRNWALERADYFEWGEGEWDYECGTGCEYTDQSVIDGKDVHTYECDEVTK